MKRMRKYLLSIIIAVALLTTNITFVFPVKAQTTPVNFEDNFSGYTSSPTEGDWVQDAFPDNSGWPDNPSTFTAPVHTLSGGKLILHGYPNGLYHFRRPSSEVRMNQTATLDFNYAGTVSPAVYLRAQDISFSAADRWTATGYYAVAVMNGGNSEIRIMRAMANKGTYRYEYIYTSRRITTNTGGSYRLEFSAKGTNPTVLTVDLLSYNNGTNHWDRVVSSSVSDSTASLQQAGSAGLSSVSGNVTVDKFTYDGYDPEMPWELDGDYMVYSDGSLPAGRFGQWVLLENGKNYEFSFYSKNDTGADPSQYMRCVYDFYGNTTSGTHTTSGATISIQPAEHDSRYHKVKYAFTVTNGYTFNVGKDSGDTNPGTVRTAKTGVFVGISAAGGHYAGFSLKASDSSTELLVNADFKKGFFGWYNYPAIDVTFRGKAISDYGITSLPGSFSWGTETAVAGTMVLQQMDGNPDSRFEKESGAIDFTDNFDRADGAVGNDWENGFLVSEFDPKIEDNQLKIKGDATGRWNIRRPWSEARLDQTASIEFGQLSSSAQPNPTVFLRIQDDSTTDAPAGYLASVNPGAGLYIRIALPNKSGWRYAELGRFSQTLPGFDNYTGRYKLELTAKGTYPTILTATFFEYNTNTENWEVLSYGSIADSTPMLQKAGTPGLSVAGSDYTTLDNFTYVGINPEAFEELEGEYMIRSNKTQDEEFGQWIYLPRGKTYEYSVYYKANQEGAEPRLRMTTNVNITTQIIMPAETEDANYHKTTYTFTVAPDAYGFDTGTGNNIPSYLPNVKKSRIFVGIHGIGDTYFSGFSLVEKGSSTNLLVNPRFNKGLYGWNTSYSSTAIDDYGVMSVSGGEITLEKIEDNEHFESIFNRDEPIPAEPTGVQSMLYFEALRNTSNLAFPDSSIMFRFPSDGNTGRKYALSFFLRDISPSRGDNYTEYSTGYRAFHFYTYNSSGNKVYLDPVLDGDKYTFYLTETSDFRFGISYFMYTFQGYISDFEMYEVDENNQVIDETNKAVLYGDFSDWTHEMYESDEPGGLSLIAMNQAETGQLETVPDGYFVLAPKDLEDKYMARITGTHNARDFCQFLKVVPDPSITYVFSYSLKIWNNQNCGPQIALDFRSIRAHLKIPYEVISVDPVTNFTVIEFSIPQTLPDGSDYPKLADGKVHLQVGIHEGGLGTTAMFANPSLTVKGDPNKTELFINSNFKKGLYGWATGATYFTHIRGGDHIMEAPTAFVSGVETAGDVILETYDELMLYRDDSDSYFDDGDWWKDLEHTTGSGDDSSITGTIKGTLLNKENKPLSGVTMVLYGDGKKSITNQTGNFVFSNLSEGAYRLYILLANGEELLYEKVLNIKARSVVNVNLVYDGETKELEGDAIIVDIPGTGDSSVVLWWMALLLAASALGILTIKRKKRMVS